jgi:hypothetical protein
LQLLFHIRNPRRLGSNAGKMSNWIGIFSNGWGAQSSQIINLGNEILIQSWQVEWMWFLWIIISLLRGDWWIISLDFILILTAKLKLIEMQFMLNKNSGDVLQIE